jgi:hypothetical protein
VAGRVFEVPFGEVYDRVGGFRVPDPFHCLAGHSNASEVVSVPMVQPAVMMEDLNLRGNNENDNINNCFKAQTSMAISCFSLSFTFN